jgi:hypothetical protein
VLLDPWRTSFPASHTRQPIAIRQLPAHTAQQRHCISNPSVRGTIPQTTSNLLGNVQCESTNIYDRRKSEAKRSIACAPAAQNQTQSETPPGDCGRSCDFAERDVPRRRHHCFRAFRHAQLSIGAVLWTAKGWCFEDQQSMTRRMYLIHHPCMSHKKKQK